MIGILLITHNGLGDSLIDCVRHVTGAMPPNLKSFSILAEDDPQRKEVEVIALIKRLDSGNGVLILTDLYGATPSNIAHRLCQPGRIEGVSGVNLPMLLRVVCSAEITLAEMVRRAVQGGRDCIIELGAGIQG